MKLEKCQLYKLDKIIGILILLNSKKLINKNFHCRELKYGPNLVYKQPWETTFRTMLTSNALTKVNKYRAIRTISVGDNRVIIGIASSHKTELTFYWNYFTNDNKWKKVNMSSAFKY